MDMTIQFMAINFSVSMIWLKTETNICVVYQVPSTIGLSEKILGHLSDRVSAWFVHWVSMDFLDLPL